MSMNIKPKNRRLLEALEYIDDKIISDVLAEVKVPAAASPEHDKKVTRRSIKYAIALAACMLLLGAVIPVVTHLIDSFSAGHGEHNDPYSLSQSELDAINEAWSGVFAESPEDVGYLKGSRFIYGKYDGAIVLGVISATDMYAEESVAGCVFKYPTGVGIKIYKDGEIHDLYSAYQSGILTAGQVKDVWRKHQINILGEDEYFEDEYVYGDYLNPVKDLEPLTSEQINDIRLAYRTYLYQKCINNWTEEYVSKYGEEEGRLILDEKARYISETASKSLFDDINTSRYYGIIDRYVVFGIAGALTLPEYPVSYSVDLYLYSFDSKEICEYSPDMLSEEGNALLEKRKTEYQDYLLKLPFDSILESYFGQIIYDDEHPLVFMHSTDRYMLIAVKSGYPVISTYDIAGYKFVFPCGVNLYLGYEGKTFSLYSAHEKGYITDDDMAEIYAAYLVYYENSNKQNNE